MCGESWRFTVHRHSSSNLIELEKIFQEEQPKSTCAKLVTPWRLENLIASTKHRTKGFEYLSKWEFNVVGFVCFNLQKKPLKTLSLWVIVCRLMPKNQFNLFYKIWSELNILNMFWKNNTHHCSLSYNKNTRLVKPRFEMPQSADHSNYCCLSSIINQVYEELWNEHKQ